MELVRISSLLAALPKELKFTQSWIYYCIRVRAVDPPREGAMDWYSFGVREVAELLVARDMRLSRIGYGMIRDAVDALFFDKEPMYVVRPRRGSRKMKYGDIRVYRAIVMADAQRCYQVALALQNGASYRQAVAQVSAP